MLRHAAFRLMTRGGVAARTAGVAFSTATTATPSVMDRLVNVTFVDPSGARRKVKCLVGKTLHENCGMLGINIGLATGGGPSEVRHTERWTEPTFGEGATSAYDHVVLVGKGVDKLPPASPIDDQMIDFYWEFDQIFSTSRLASSVVLTKDMDGLIVFVPDRIDDYIP